MTVKPAARFQTFFELKDFIYSTVCQREHFVEGAFPMTERVLKRRDQICGFLFSIHGPRSVVCNVVFETERNAVHFYSAAGERLTTVLVELATGPSVLQTASV